VVLAILISLSFQQTRFLGTDTAPELCARGKVYSAMRLVMVGVAA
jgi:hypothetical protein